MKLRTGQTFKRNSIKILHFNNQSLNNGRICLCTLRKKGENVNMQNNKKTYIFSVIFLMSLVAHTLLLFSNFNKLGALSELITQDKTQDRIKLKIRKVGKKDSKKKELLAIPSKKSEGAESNLLKKFQMTDSSLIKDQIIEKSSAINRQKKIQKKQRISFQQARIMEEVKKEKRDENPLLNHTNYHLKFEPPKGIEENEFNELEKVFYSFFRRAALQYVTSVNRAYSGSLQDTPYITNILKSHEPIELKAKIRYDKDGNAEVVKVLNSSNEDEVALMFEKILAGMTKIPNIAKEIQDESGNMTMFYQFNINK